MRSIRPAEIDRDRETKRELGMGGIRWPLDPKFESLILSRILFSAHRHKHSSMRNMLVAD